MGAILATWGADARYTRLVQQHGPGLLRLAVLLTGNRHDAEDIVQEAIISASASWSISRPVAGVAYLRRAVANKAIDLTRKHKELTTGSIVETLVEDAGFFRHESDQRFFRLVNTLPERQKATLVLKYYADMDDRSIAQALGVTVATVRSQAQHGLSKLRAMDLTVEGRI